MIDYDTKYYARMRQNAQETGPGIWSEPRSFWSQTRFQNLENQSFTYADGMWSIFSAMSRDGVWLAVGAYQSRSARVFRRVDGVWTLAQTLAPTSSGTMAYVSIANDASRLTLSVSGVGCYVYRNDAGTWILEQTIAWAKTGIFAVINPRGDWLAISDGAGTVKIYKRTDTSWTLTQTAAITGTSFGSSICFSDTPDRLLIGWRVTSGNGQNRVYTLANDFFGYEASIAGIEPTTGVHSWISQDGEYVYTGDYVAGSVGIYKRGDGEWGGIARLVRGPGTGFGQSLCLTTDRKFMLVGAYLNQAAFLYRWHDDHYNLVAEIRKAETYFGDSVAISDLADTVAIGSRSTQKLVFYR